MTQKYNIVGRQIEFGDAWYLHGQDANGDDIITKDVSLDGKAGEPLTVEFIGRTMLDLSNTPIKKGQAGYDQVLRKIKHCLVVVAVAPEVISNADREAIWEKLEIELTYDTRDPQSDGPDLNKRIFAVPAIGALQDKVDTFTGSMEPGFLPPLTYSLDRTIMANFFAKRINQVIDQVANASPTATLAEIKEELQEAVNDALSVTEATGSATLPLDIQKEEILTKPVSAFYRAIGVYLTQMCD